MASRLPSHAQVIELLAAEFDAAGYEIEDVVIDAGAPLPRIAVIADGDAPLDLDTAAALSRSASDRLDELDIADRYILEVSSPGVGRPLTTAKHFRRARGRKAELTLSDGSTLTGRLGPVEGENLAVVVRAGRDWELRPLPLDGIVQAVVQVEFSPPAQRELELAGGSQHVAGTEAAE